MGKAGQAAKHYICQECGAVSSKWAGKCESCGAWNTLAEEIVEASPWTGGKSPKTRGKVSGVSFSDLRDENAVPPPRCRTGMAELDRVTGGGFVPGSALLIGGDPGIGKSTLLLQAACALANRGLRCAYVSGEESVDQVRLRARRLGLEHAPLALAAATNVREIAATIENAAPPLALIVIDSIQTMYADMVDSAPGTVTQVRVSAHEITRMAKKHGTTVLFVGHVTKDGQIAGPRVLEHMVDTVLYFEGDRGHQFRILRSVKNRFGPTDEIGVFEMGTAGLAEVENPSALFLSQRQEDMPGCVVLAALEGTRPVLVEVQALVAPSALATPRRAVVGWDTNRLAMILAVLEARCGLHLSANDVFLNIAGGIRIAEPAADLAVAAALVSSLTGAPVPAETVLFGEIGLAGEIRAVAQPDLRLKEAAKLGFRQAIIPLRSGNKKSAKGQDPLSVREAGHVLDLLELFPQEDRRRRAGG